MEGSEILIKHYKPEIRDEQLNHIKLVPKIKPTNPKPKIVS